MSTQCPCERPNGTEKRYLCPRITAISGVETRMTAHWCQLYHTDTNYRQALDGGYGPGQPRPDGAGVEPGSPKQEAKGTGTELTKIFAMIGIKTCFGCDWMAAKMDRKGPQWCRENIETIADWLREQAKKRGWPFSRQAVKLMIRWAIRRAEKHDPATSK